MFSTHDAYDTEWEHEDTGRTASKASDDICDNCGDDIDYSGDDIDGTCSCPEHKAGS